MESVTRSGRGGRGAQRPRAVVVPTHELTGQWVGHYSQHDSVRLITAEFVQDGPRLIGVMSDACTTIEGSVADLVVEQRMPPGADERIVARIRAMCPGLEEYAVRTIVEIPRFSTVDGRIEEGRVEFLKTYRGEHFAGYQVGERRIGLRGTDQEVVYRGLLDGDGMEITGSWCVDGIRKAGSFSHRSAGSFSLRRVRKSRRPRVD